MGILEIYKIIQIFEVLQNFLGHWYYLQVGTIFLSDHRLLFILCPQITANLRSEVFCWSVSLPTKIRKYCVLTSHHAIKRDFEIRTHTKITALQISFGNASPIFYIFLFFSLPNN